MAYDGTYEDDDAFYDDDELNSSSQQENESKQVENDQSNEEEDVDEASLAKSYSLSLDGGDELDVEDGSEEEVDEASLAKSYSLSLDDEDELVVEDDNDEEDVFSPEERLRMFSDDVLSCCFGKGKEITQYALDKLLSMANPRLFRDENYVLFYILFSYRGKLKRISIDEEFIRLFLKRNRNILTNGKGFIDINAYGEVDGSPELGYISGVIKHFKRLSGMEDMSIADFETCLEKYLIEFKAIEASKVYNQAQVILTEGTRLGRKYYFGFDASFNYTRKKLAEIEGLVNFQKGNGFTSLREVIMDEKVDTKKSVKIGDFGKLKALTDAYGGIYTGNMYQVLAPPKAGKTKFCTRVVHTVSVVFGNNVSVWAQEGGTEAFSAQLRAIHFDYTYNTGRDITERKYGVTQEVIMRDNFPSDELRQLELSSKIDLASNPDYGNVDFIDRPFNVETFLDDIDTSVKGNNSKLLVIDYLQLIGTATGMSERERIATAYQKTLTYCKDNNIAVMTPGQYTQEVFKDLIAKKDTGDADMRASGGGSAEVLRTPDVIFALWATTQDLLNNSMKILSMPCRFNKPFPEIPVHMDLGVCQFVSV